jgi:hypothetical protein
VWKQDGGALPSGVRRALDVVNNQPDAREAVVRAWLLLGEAAGGGRHAGSAGGDRQQVRPAPGRGP